VLPDRFIWSAKRKKFCKTRSNWAEKLRNLKEKTMKKKIFIYALLLFSLAVSVNAQSEKTQVLAQSKRVVAALKNKDMKRLATLIHPQKGVRFSPYGYVDTEKDLVFKSSQIPSLMLTRRTHNWGAADGTGDQINLGFPAYFNKFVYDKDFARAPQIVYNRIAKQGNTIVNVAEAYKNAKFVEYHFPGTKKYDGMDWRSLRLVFEKSGTNWYLVGICHDQWTI
jgi:hypothetical protein